MATNKCVLHIRVDASKLKPLEAVAKKLAKSAKTFERLLKKATETKKIEVLDAQKITDSLNLNCDLLREVIGASLKTS